MPHIERPSEGYLRLMQSELTPKAVLERHFGFREFLDGQERVIRSVLAGDDSLVVLPTGGGKSLCYQLPAQLLEGITLVVSPLIALMKDQVDSLAAKGIPAAFINSSLSDSELDDRIARMSRGEFRLVYVAPERFKSARFVSALFPLSIALFAIDEAHCISQWGHDFRPDYLRLKRVLRELGQPPVIALTATATPEVRDDIIAQLNLGQAGRRPPRTFVTGFARHNLGFAVTPVRNNRGKLERVLDAIRAGHTGIVYCATRKNVERRSGELRESGIDCVAYHGGMTDEQRTAAQTRFMSGSVPVAVATNAFGMGIDRADLRFILHYDIPGSVEAYYQEAGRAGRDGEPACCELLFNYADMRTQQFFIEGANPTRAVIADTREALVRLCAKGPVKLAITAIAKSVASAPNDMAVASALHLLERAGFIRRDYAPGGRTYTTELIQPVKSPDSLNIDYKRLDTKRERDELKLRRMVDYAGCSVCRQYYILNYFGDTDAEDHRVCGRCDRCRSSSAAHTSARIPTAAETIVIQKALCCVGRLQGRFGRGRITQTLVGSRAKEALEAGLDQQSTYGLLADEGSDFVWSLIDALIIAGCIAVNGDKYPTLSLTPLGYEAAQGRKSVVLAMPTRRPAPARKAQRAKPGKKARDTASAEFPATGTAATVFERLKEWRRRKAAAMGGMHAYIIYPDKTLKELALSQPRTREDLLLIRGIGPAKARQFGKATLETIRSAMEDATRSQGIQRNPGSPIRGGRPAVAQGYGKAQQ